MIHRLLKCREDLPQSATISRQNVLATAALGMATAALGMSDAALSQTLEPVSPGHVDSVARVASACPTFHWGASDVSGAAAISRQFLVAFEMATGPDGHDGHLAEHPAFEIDLPASARGFTLDAEHCLTAGRYAWAVGAEIASRGAAEQTDTRIIWSDPLRFEVPEQSAQHDEAEGSAAQNGGIGQTTNTDRSTTRAGRQAERATRGSRSRAVGVSGNGSVADAPAAVRGESLDTGDSHGVAGMTHAPGGAGVLAANESGGADLLLDGGADTETDTLVSQSTLDRSSSGAEVFSFVNSGSGSMTLQVDGETVATGPFVSSVATGTGLTGGGNGDVTVQADLSALQARVSSSCPIGSSIRVIDAAGAVTCETDDSGEVSAGNQLALDGGVLDVVEGPGSDLDADTLDGLQAAAFASTSHDHHGNSWSAFATNGLGIANTSPLASANGLLGEILTTNPGALSAGVYGYNRGTSGAGIGVRGEQDGSGWGVYGRTPSGRGVFGTSVTGTGVYGSATDPSDQNVGVFATSSSSSGYGLFATGTGQALHATSAHHIVAQFLSGHDGIGNTYAVAVDAEAVGAGVRGRGKDGILGSGVMSLLTNGNSIDGVRGSSDGLAQGHLGYIFRTFGGSIWNYAVFGRSGSATGQIVRAGRFEGDVDVTGTLTKGGGSFLIDHPLDPENKTLSHSFVESPDMMNIYNGNVVLDDSGEAWVTLPEWFDALNRDFRYQLTGIGAFAQLYIAEEIEGNRFKIAGGAPGMKVSWMVTGVRQDPWANANRIPVESDKHPELKGRFVHPAAYGQPPESALHWTPEEPDAYTTRRDTDEETQDDR